MIAKTWEAIVAMLDPPFHCRGDVVFELILLYFLTVATTVWRWIRLLTMFSLLWRCMCDSDIDDLAFPCWIHVVCYAMNFQHIVAGNLTLGGEPFVIWKGNTHYGGILVTLPISCTWVAAFWTNIVGSKSASTTARRSWIQHWEAKPSISASDSRLDNQKALLRARSAVNKYQTQWQKHIPVNMKGGLTFQQ